MPKTTRTWLVLAALLTVSALAFAGGTGEASTAKTLTFGLSMAHSENLDVHVTTYSDPFVATAQICEPLISRDGDGNPVPVLLTGLPTVSTDGLLYSGTLKKGVTFHDGSTLTTADVKATFERIFNPKTASPHVAMFKNLIEGSEAYTKGTATSISGITIVDDYSFSIKLTTSNASFLNILATTHLSIFPAEASTTYKDTWGRTVYVGTGPFKIREFVPNTKLVLERYAGYHGGKKDLEAIVFQNMDENTALLEFEAGNVDVTQVANAALLESYRANPKYAANVVTLPTYGVVAISFNMKMAPFSDLRVRRAIGMAIDRASLVKNFFRGNAVAAKSFVSPGILGFDPKRAPIAYDPEGAKKLLAEAGFPNGIEVEAITREGTESTQVWEFLQQQFKAAGITMKLRVLDAAGVTDLRNNGKLTVYMITWISDTGDPHDFYQLYGSPFSVYLSNFYQNADFDAALATGLTIGDPAKRAAHYQAMDLKLTSTDLAVTPLYHPSTNFLVSGRISNLDLRGLARLYDAKKK